MTVTADRTGASTSGLRASRPAQARAGTREQLSRAERVARGKDARVAAPLEALPAIAAAALRARRMHRRWPWFGCDRYLGTPLVEIRRKYGVLVPGRCGAAR